MERSWFVMFWCQHLVQRTKSWTVASNMGRLFESTKEWRVELVYFGLTPCQHETRQWVGATSPLSPTESQSLYYESFVEEFPGSLFCIWAGEIDTDQLVIFSTHSLWWAEWATEMRRASTGYAVSSSQILEEQAASGDFTDNAIMAGFLFVDCWSSSEQHKCEFLGLLCISFITVSSYYLLRDSSSQTPSVIRF